MLSIALIGCKAAPPPATELQDGAGLGPGPEVVADSSPDPAATSDTGGYEIRGRSFYEGAGSGGEVGVLYHRGTFVDSIDLYVGAQPLGGDSVLFLPVRSQPAGLDVIQTTTEYVVYDGKVRRPLASILPSFDDTFSSPAVIGRYIYYWGVEPTEGAGRRISANRFDVDEKTVDTTFLFEAGLETDNPAHFAAPAREADNVRYETYQRLWILGPDHRVVSPQGGSSILDDPHASRSPCCFAR